MKKDDALRLNAVFMDQLARRFADDLMDAINIVAADASHIRFMASCGNFDDTLAAEVVVLVRKYEGDHVDHFEEARFFYGMSTVDIVKGLRLAVEAMNERLDEEAEMAAKGGAA